MFEQDIHKAAEIVHRKGGLVYMDGANMNALVGKVRPGDFGIDVMHLLPISPYWTYGSPGWTAFRR